MLLDAEPGDFCLFVVDGRFVFSGLIGGPSPRLTGELADAGTLLKTSIDWAHTGGPTSDDPPGTNELKPWWWTVHSQRMLGDPSSLAWEYDEHLRQLDPAAIFNGAVAMTRVNLSYASKKVMRRIVGAEST